MANHKGNSMSKIVTLSDTFYDALAEKLELIVKQAKNPSLENRFDYVNTPMYEYDTNIRNELDKAFELASKEN